MVTKYSSESDLVADLIYGRGDNPRDTAPEPSLLPQLGAKLCHYFSIVEVLEIAHRVAMDPGNAPPFTPLWEATVWGIAEREDLQSHLGDFDSVTDEHWQVIRILQTRNVEQARELAGTGVLIGGDYPDVAGLARLSPLLPHDEVARLLDPSSASPVDLDSESLRSLLTAASVHNLEVPDDWLDEALSDNWFGTEKASHLAHVLPSLPAARRTSTADTLARKVSDWSLPPDQRALWVSRIAPFVSSPDVWGPDRLLVGLSRVWRNHIEQLQSATWPSEPWADVFRAHPAYRQFADVEQPHEVTADAPHDIMDRLSPVTRAAAGPERGREKPGEEEGADPDTPRRLQADVQHERSGKHVDAFIAGEKHIVAVSIGRDGQVQANADIEAKLEDLFNNTDAERLELPVWFHYRDERQEGSITVPRQLREDSTSHEFSLIAPDDGRVVARIHVLRPDGELLLQSAALVGDVVKDIDTAKSHANGLQLNVDVLAGNLGDPADSASGHMLVAGQESAITRSEGKIIELSLAELKDQLGRMVNEIEFSADAQDLDDKTIEDTLAKLARGGRALWAKYRRQLQELAVSDYLQIVSLRDDFVLPLELFYDGPALSASSKLCTTWRDALMTGACPSCGTDEDSDGPAAICPLNFWSMSKIIERRMADAKGGPFRVLGERSQAVPKLRSIKCMVLSASSRVESDQVDELADFAQNTLQIGAETAKNWAEWVSAIEAETPELLVAMPHNGDIDDGFNSALFLGEPEDDEKPTPDESTLPAGQVTNAHVQPSDSRPGPVVLLLGCDTQYQQGKLAGFSGEFRDNGAALTVGTIGELRADQATLAARILMEKIMSDTHKGASIGLALREARRELLGKNLIMALLLVANGDAEWTLPS